MKKLLLFICTLLTAMIINAADNKNWQTITLYTESFPPFQWSENNVTVGPMFTIMELICKEAKINCKIVMLKWKDTIAKAESGEGEGIFSIVELPERRAKFYLGNPIVKSGYAAFVLKENKWVYTKPSDLNGLDVAAYGPSGTSIIAKESIAMASDVEFHMESSILGSFQNLVEEKYGLKGVVVANADVGNYLIKQHSISGLRNAGFIKPVSFTFGLSRKNSKSVLILDLNKALQKLQHDGVISKILAKYNMVAAEEWEEDSSTIAISKPKKKVEGKK